MDGVLSGLDGVAAYIDEIVVTRKTEQEHLKNLDTEKYSHDWKEQTSDLSLQNQLLCYQAFSIWVTSSQLKAYIQPSQEKVRALFVAPAPNNLRSFLDKTAMKNYMDVLYNKRYGYNIQ